MSRFLVLPYPNQECESIEEIGVKRTFEDSEATPPRTNVVTRFPVSVAVHVPPLDPTDTRGIAFTFNFDLEADFTSDTLDDLVKAVEHHVNTQPEMYATMEWRLFAAKSKDWQGREILVSHQTFLKRAKNTLLGNAFQLMTGNRSIVCYGLLYARGSNDHLEHERSLVTQMKRTKS